MEIGVESRGGRKYKRMGNDSGRDLGEVRKKGEEGGLEAGESVGGGPSLLWQGVGD